jgi:paraquat-inducible protein B
MSKKANKTMIGGFVVGAVLLVFAGVLIFGSGKFMKKTNEYALYFEGSVKGLSVGASVVFRGVKVGSVESLVIRADAETLSAQIPVIIEIEPDRIEVVQGTRDPRRNMPLLIERGLRAQLEMQSLVTGQLMIQMDFHPETPLRLVGTDTEYLEIPTIPSAFEKITKKMSELPIGDLVAKLIATIDAVKEVVESPEIKETIHSLKLAVNDVRKLINDIDAQVEPLATSAKDTLGTYGSLAKNADKQIEPLVKDVRTTVRDYDKLAKGIDRHVDPVLSNVDEAVKVAASALKRAESTTKDIQDVVSKDSVMTNELKTALRELSAASRSIRVWADYLERHPEALIRGKGGYRR